MSTDLQSLRKKHSSSHNILNSEDGTSLYLREWLPTGHSETAILISHGITAHSGSYDDIGVTLSEMGYAVYGFDLRGHGLSGGNRGDYESYEQVLDDFQAVLEFLESNHTQIILLGHSMGVTTSLIMVKHFELKINGLVLLSGRIKIPKEMIPQLGLFDKIKIMVSNIFLPGNQTIRIKLPEGLIDTDELFNYKYTTRFMKSLKLGRFILPEKINKPVFVAVGESDELWDVEDIEEFYDMLPAEDKQFQEIQNAKHMKFPNGWIEESGLHDWLTSKFQP